MDLNGSHDIYEVKEIVGMKKVSGEYFYKVRWRGYGPDNDTWEPQSNFFTCHDVIEEYKSKIKGTTTLSNGCGNNDGVGIRESENSGGKSLKNRGAKSTKNKIVGSNNKSNCARLHKKRLKSTKTTATNLSSSSSGLNLVKHQVRSRRTSTSTVSSSSSSSSSSSLQDVKRLTIKKETVDQCDSINSTITISKKSTVKLRLIVTSKDNKLKSSTSSSCDGNGEQSKSNYDGFKKKIKSKSSSRKLNASDEKSSNSKSHTNSPVPSSLYPSSYSSFSSSSSSSSVSSSSSSSSSPPSAHSIWSNVNYNLNHPHGSEGKTSLIRASEAGNVKLVEFLLDSGAAKDVIDSKGNTALILASKNGHHDVVRSLLLHGANFSIINDAGSSALRTAKLFGNNEAQHILTKHVSQITMALEKQVIELLRSTARISHALFPIQCHSSNENVRFRLLFNFDSIEPVQPGISYLLFISDSTFSHYKPISLKFSTSSSANVNVYLNRTPQKYLKEDARFVFSFKPLRRGVNELLLTIKESKARQCFIICAYQVTLLNNSSSKVDID